MDERKHPTPVPYPLPYTLCDETRMTGVRHLGSRRFHYTATLLGDPLATDAAARKDAKVFIKFTPYAYRADVHRAVAASGLAPPLVSCTPLPGGLTEVRR